MNLLRKLLNFRKGDGMQEQDVPQLDVYREKIQACEQRAMDKGDALLIELHNTLIQRDRAQARVINEKLELLFDHLETIDQAKQLLELKLPSAKEGPPIPTYLVSSWFLAECCQYLTSDHKRYERLHFVTGSKIGMVRTFDRMVNVAMDKQSSIYASADLRDTQKVLFEMDTWGHAVHGLFHSHPGQGGNATGPSGTDLATHERYERGGYPLIGAIFVRDGYVRFFSKNARFTIHIHGKGVEQIDEHLFKINSGHVQNTISQIESPGRSSGDGQAGARAGVLSGETEPSEDSDDRSGRPGE